MSPTNPFPVRSGSLDMLILQATPFCNLNCDYCYLPDRDVGLRMSEEVLRTVLTKVLRSRYVTNSLSLVWHKGEPMAVPIDWYRRAFEILAECTPPGMRIGHYLQTNATLVNDDWCDLFVRHGMKVGVSIDGPAAFHDHHRRTRSGGGTHERVMTGVRRLLAAGLDVRAIAVVTSASIDHPDEMFRFFAESGIRKIGFNWEEVEGLNKTSSLAIDGIDQRARAFLRRFLDLNERAGVPLRVREVARVSSFVLETRSFISRNQENTPFRILSVDHKGNVSTFSPELFGMRDRANADFVFGNLMTEEMEAIAASPRLSAVATEIGRGIDACRGVCPYFGLCGGGAPSNKLAQAGTFETAETLHCRLAMKAVVDVVLERLERPKASVPVP